MECYEVSQAQGFALYRLDLCCALANDVGDSDWGIDQGHCI